MNGYLTVQEPLWLMALGTIPVLGLLAAWDRLRRRREWEQLGRSDRPVKVREIAFLLALASLVLALSRPGWGRPVGEREGAGRDVVLAVDTSRSMGCEDAIPNRLKAAVESAESLVKSLGNGRADRAAVVAFSGRAVVRCPLTENLGAVVDALRHLRAGDVSPGGTDLGKPLRRGLRLLDDPGSTNADVIVLFSDGEDHEGTWRAALHDLEDGGVPVYSVAVGDAKEGAIVPDGAGGPVLWEGEPVRSRRRDDALLAISQATGGLFFPAARKPVDLRALGRGLDGPELAERRRVKTGALAERFPLFLGLSVALLAWASRVPMSRARVLSVALALTLVGTSLAAVPSEARHAVESGCLASERGDGEAALKAFEKAIRLAPSEALPRYDAGTVLEALERFEDAERRYSEAARLAHDPVLKAKIAFARGNALVSLGRFEEAIALYDECLRRAEEGASLGPIRGDAETNRTFAVEHLPPTPPANPQPSGEGPSQEEPQADPAREQDDSQGDKAGETGKSSSPTTRDSQSKEQTGGPQDRLQSALDRIREGKDRRSRGPVRHQEGNGKDW
jgi:Ca-activated chloride channel family protein